MSATDTILNQPQGTCVPISTGIGSKNLQNERDVQRAIRNLELDLIRERLDSCRVDMNTPAPEIEPLITIGGSCVCSRGNISVVVGEAKSKKTFLSTALIASAMAFPTKHSHVFDTVENNLSLQVAWMDTEQSIHHVRKVVERIYTMTGFTGLGIKYDARLDVYTMREYLPKERLHLLYDVLKGAPLPLDIVVIDGIADLVNNTNDIEESDRIVSELLSLSTAYNCHIMCVLHTNPGSDKARGHLGSSLQRKAESVLYVHKVGECSVVEPQYCRNVAFERFAFTINAEGLPELCALPTENEPRVDPLIKLLRDEYGGGIERSVLVSKLQERLNMSQSAAQMRILRSAQRGIIKITDDNIVRLPPT